MKNQTNSDNSFITSDFYTAAFLLAGGYRLCGIDKADSRRFRFVFDDRPDRVQFVEGYFSGLVDVNAKDFVSAIKELKSLMYNDAL